MAEKKGSASSHWSCAAAGAAPSASDEATASATKAERIESITTHRSAPTSRLSTAEEVELKAAGIDVAFAGSAARPARGRGAVAGGDEAAFEAFAGGAGDGLEALGVASDRETIGEGSEGAREVGATFEGDSLRAPGAVGREPGGAAVAEEMNGGRRAVDVDVGCGGEGVAPKLERVALPRWSGWARRACSR